MPSLRDNSWGGVAHTSPWTGAGLPRSPTVATGESITSHPCPATRMALGAHLLEVEKSPGRWHAQGSGDFHAVSASRFAMRMVRLVGRAMPAVSFSLSPNYVTCQEANEKPRLSAGLPCRGDWAPTRSALVDRVAPRPTLGSISWGSGPVKDICYQVWTF